MKRLLSVLALFMFATPALAVVAPIKVCDNITLAASTTTNCTPIEVPASTYFSYQVYCNETTGDSMSVGVDWVGGSSTSALAVPSGVSQLLTAYTTEGSWSTTAAISTPIVPYGTIQFTENNGDADIVCSAILNVNSLPVDPLDSPVFTGPATTTGLLTAQGGVTVGETLGPETLTLTCADVGLATPVGAWSCAGDTITRTASGANLTLAIGPAVTAGTEYRGSYTMPTLTAGTFSLSVGGYTQGTIGTATTAVGYFPAGAVTAPTLTVVAASAGTITLSSLSVKPVTSTITPASGPLVLSKTLASATANEAAVSIVGKQTGAGGNKTALRVESVGSGTGIEYIQEWYADGVRQFYLTNAGATVASSGSYATIFDGAGNSTPGVAGIFKAAATLTNAANSVFVFGGKPVIHSAGTDLEAFRSAPDLSNNHTGGRFLAYSAPSLVSPDADIIKTVVNMGTGWQYALGLEDGAQVANGTTATTFTALGPTGAQLTIQGWVPIVVNGTPRYIPYW